MRFCKCLYSLEICTRVYPVLGFYCIFINKFPVSFSFAHLPMCAFKGENIGSMGLLKYVLRGTQFCILINKFFKILTRVFSSLFPASFWQKANLEKLKRFRKVHRARNAEGSGKVKSFKPSTTSTHFLRTLGIIPFQLFDASEVTDDGESIVGAVGRRIVVADAKIPAF